MDREELIRAFRVILNKEEELYELCSRLAEETESDDIKEIMGNIAHEEYSRLNTLIDKYQDIINHGPGNYPRPR